MLTLYVKTGCPYSAVALKKVEDLGLRIEEKNVADPGVVDEMIAIGGRKREPFLVDHDRGVSLYESGAIADYLEAHYGGDGAPAQSGSTPRLHREDDTDRCEACE